VVFLYLGLRERASGLEKGDRLYSSIFSRQESLEVCFLLGLVVGLVSLI
jgi:hypothetical protein